MATKPPPPPRKNVGPKKGDPPEPTQVKSNLAKPEPGQIVPLNFKVPAEFKRDIKIAAATHGITQSALIQQAFKFWSEHHG